VDHFIIQPPGAAGRRDFSSRRRKSGRDPLSAGFRPANVTLAVAAVFMSVAGAALGQPAGMQAIHGQASLAQQGNSFISEMTSSPLTTFMQLLLKEQGKQSVDRQLGQDNVVDDSQCRR
jgi:hypothetical protein